MKGFNVVVRVDIGFKVRDDVGVMRVIYGGVVIEVVVSGDRFRSSAMVVKKTAIVESIRRISGNEEAFLVSKLLIGIVKVSDNVRCSNNVR